jgi:hypothetical protein
MEGEGKEGRQGHLSRHRWRPGPGRASLLPTLRRDGLLLRHHRQRREAAQYSTSAARRSARELFRQGAVRGSERPRRTRTGRWAIGVAEQMMASMTPPPSNQANETSHEPDPMTPGPEELAGPTAQRDRAEGEMMAPRTEAPPTEPRATRPLSPPIVLCKRAPLSAGPSGQPPWVRSHMYTAQAN